MRSRGTGNCTRHSPCSAIAGIAHVALGSDYDGAVTVPWDTRGVPRITEELLRAAMSREYIRAVMGGNARAFLLQNLPASRK